MSRPRVAPVLVALAVLATAADCGKPTFERRGGGDGNTVGEACTQQSDCQSGLVCFAKKCAEGLPPGSCTLPGSAKIVAGDPVVAGTTDPTSGTCVQPVRDVTASFPGADVQSFGTHAVGDSIAFTVPPGSSSFTIVSQEVDGSALDAVSFSTDPNATPDVPNAPAASDVFAPGSTAKFYDSSVAPMDPSADLATYFGFVAGAGSMTFPNTTRALDLFRSEGGVTPGTWRFTVSDLARDCAVVKCTPVSTAGRYDVKVLTRSAPMASTGTLDLDLYLVSYSTDPTHPAITAQDALADPATNDDAFQIHRLVSEMAKVFDRAGLCLGQVRIHEVPESVRAASHDLDIDTSGPCAPMSQLFTMAASTNGVHLFLVDSLVTTQGTSGSVIVGIDGSIPGPSAVPGTVNSGAAVVLADLGVGGRAACSGSTDIAHCGADKVAYIAAHEAGHWLGLYHTTESSGTWFDALTDTPRCLCTSCAPTLQRGACSGGNVVVDASMCGQTTANGCSGGQNLMFWQINRNVSQGALSPQQGEVMRYNPAVH